MGLVWVTLCQMALFIYSAFHRTLPKRTIRERGRIRSIWVSSHPQDTSTWLPYGLLSLPLSKADLTVLLVCSCLRDVRHHSPKRLGQESESQPRILLPPKYFLNVYPLPRPYPSTSNSLFTANIVALKNLSSGLSQIGL